MSGHDQEALPGPLGDLTAAVALLTRLPLPDIWYMGPIRAAGLWAFPVVGVLIGLAGGGVLALAHWLGLPPGIAALLSIGMTVLLTGAMHEDGLADFCDGIGGGRTLERKLEIMRDSRLGTYGALGLFLVLGLRWQALASFAEPQSAILALVIIEAVSRALMLVPVLLQPARADGLGTMLAGTSARHVIVTLVLPAALAGLMLGWPALGLIAAGLAASLAITLIANRYLGGYTGDTLGAAQQAAAVALLLAAL